MSKSSNHSYGKSVQLSRTRRAILWASVAICLLLAALSIVASFLGIHRTRAIFTSIPVGALWAVLVILLAAGPIVFRQLRRPGLLAVHIGPVLILLGAGWGSQTVLRLRHGLGGQVKHAKGAMVVYQGKESNTVLDPGGKGRLGTLDFDVHLEKFWIEYYPMAREESWVFTVETIVPEQAGPIRRWQKKQIPWRLKQDVQLAFCDITLRVEDYHLVQYGDGADAPILPSVKVLLKRGSERLEELLEPLPGVPYVRVPLARLYDSAGDWQQAGAPVLYIEPPSPMVKDYKSTLIIRRDGNELARKTIEVNDPLHYGGYHFYQQSYDRAAGQYSVLTVASDSGLHLVYAGFGLLCGGMIWHVLPLKLPWRRRKKEAE